LPTDPPDGRVEYIKKDLGAPAADGEAEPGDNEPEKEGGEDGGSGK
jgi:hypothetical protein